MLMIKPADDEVFSSFIPVELQIKDMEKTINFLYGKDLPHNYCFYDEDGDVLMTGLYEISPGVFDSYTIFSENWKPLYYKYATRFFKKYINHINYDIIFHVVKKDRPWTIKMVKMFGFKEYQEEDDCFIFAVESA